MEPGRPSGQSGQIRPCGGGLDTGKKAPQEQGLTQGLWRLSLQPEPSSHTPQPLPVCVWCLLSHCPSPGAQGECLRVCARAL